MRRASLEIELDKDECPAVRKLKITFESNQR